MYFVDHASLNQRKRLKRPVDLLCENQRGILQLALTVDQRMIAEIANHDRGADHDRRNEQRAAENEIPDRTVTPHGSLPEWRNKVKWGHGRTSRWSATDAVAVTQSNFLMRCRPS